MKRLAKTAIGLGAVATAMAGIAAPAEAHGGGAVIAGLLGLGLGAAIASDRPHYRGGYYGYAPPPPPPAPVVYEAPPPPPPPPPSYGYEYVQRCRVINQWDDWAGRYVQTRRCW